MINIQNITMHYGPTVALDEASFSVEKGEVVGLLGPNGAGKSTMMKILTTFICPFSGTATVAGFDVVDESLKVREAVGYLPETVPLYTDMRVDEYLAFVATARGLTSKLRKKRLSWVKEQCGLVPVWKHEINELSKGFRQRVGIAQAIVHDPQVLILDEPTNGLDPVQIIGIRHLIKDLAKDKAVVFSSHILQEVEAIADRIVIIHEGRIIAQGTKEELARQAGSQETKNLPSLEKLFIGLLTADRGGRHV